MNRTLIVVAVIFLMNSQALAQSQEIPKFEVAAEFTTLEREAFPGRRTEPGIGGRFTSTSTRSSVLKRRVIFSQSNVLSVAMAETSRKGSPE